MVSSPRFASACRRARSCGPISWPDNKVAADYPVERRVCERRRGVCRGDHHEICARRTQTRRSKLSARRPSPGGRRECGETTEATQSPTRRRSVNTRSWPSSGAPACNRRGSRSLTRARAGMAAGCPRKSGKSQGLQLGNTASGPTRVPSTRSALRRSGRAMSDTSAETPRHAADGASAGLPRFRGTRCYAAGGSSSRR